MKWTMFPRLKLYSFIFSMPLIDLAINQILFKDRLWKELGIWLFSFPAIMVFGLVNWFILVKADNIIEKKYPGLPQSLQRVMFKFLVVVILSVSAVMVLFYVYDHFQILDYQYSTTDMLKGLFVIFGISMVFESLHEGDYALSRYRETEEEKETFHQLSVQQEFNALKNQVNPHFLFNCFNTLSSLIEIDKQKADVFLNELSKVYRYLLKNNEDGLSTVDNEIKFIRSYFKLLQTRHGDAVQLNIDIDKRYGAYLLPSLSLQLLVENVVKHNVLSKSMPLVIDIFTPAGNKMVVNNNLQRRSQKVPSNKVGLDNIKTKYELLHHDGFQVIEDEKNFTVVLPLIWNNNTGKPEELFKEIKAI